MTVPAEKCWSAIGVWGDRTCPELGEFTHCRNCPAFHAASRTLLSTTISDGYQDEWAGLLAQTPPRLEMDQTSAMILRIGGEWLAVQTTAFRQVVRPGVVHRIPHRSDHVLLGVTSVGGALHLCVSLKELLVIDEAPDGKEKAEKKLERFLVLEHQEEVWVAIADEVAGLHRFPLQKLRPAPATVSKAAVSYTRGLVRVGEREAGLLDHELLFYHLKRRVQHGEEIKTPARAGKPQ
jgi:chemotaxis-related protein WspD